MRSVSLCFLLIGAILAIEIPIRRLERKDSESASGTPIDLDTGSKAFVGVVSIGTPGQDFNVAFDTSTSALWVPDASSGARKNVFDSEKSRSYVKGTGSTNLTFLGSEIEAVLGYDTLRIGAHYRPGLTANNVQFGLVKEFDDSYQNVRYDGVFGLGLASENGVVSPIKQLADHGVIPSPLLSVYLLRQDPDNVVDGVLTIGQLDRHRCLPVTRYIEVEKEEGWVFSATTFNLTSSYGARNESWTGVLDLSSEYIHLPKVAFTTLLKFYNAKLDSRGRIIYSCARSSYINLDVGGEILSIPSRRLSVPHGGSDCQFKIKETGPHDKYDFRYGLPALNDYCAILDYNGRLALPKKRV